MMGIGWGEMIVLIIVALLVFGPHELPQVLRAAGGYMRQFRRMTNDLRREVDNALRETEREFDLEGRSKRPSRTNAKPPDDGASLTKPAAAAGRKHAKMSKNQTTQARIEEAKDGSSGERADQEHA